MSGGLERWVAIGVGGLVVLVVLVGAAAGGALGALADAPGGGQPPSGALATPIPPAYLDLYQQAAATCPGLPWTILAAVGMVESSSGTSDLPGVHSGANAAGAEGPMQFEPGTFAEYDLPVPPGGADPPSPYDPTDAVYAAARDLCANGARNGADLAEALLAYNHATWYVAEVLAIAQALASQPGMGAGGGAG